MWCVTLDTRCRLCGAPFQELFCTDNRGVVWKEADLRSPEHGSPWCPHCLDRVNKACETICADLAISLEPVSVQRSGGGRLVQPLD